jgi:uncharacterized protein YfaP (DUF2135 family)
VVTVLLQPKSGSTTNTPIQTITGTVVDVTATTVTITVNGTAQAVPVNDGMFTTAIVLGAGANAISITATNASGSSSQSASSTVTYSPLAPAVTVTTPGGAVSGSASYTVTGTAPLNSQVTVNDIVLNQLTGTQWSATISLVPGFNPIIVTAMVAGSAVTSSVTSSITYAPLQPTLAITSPAADSAVAQVSPVISGVAGDGAAITATLNGTAIPVSVAADGTFTAYPTFPAIGTYSIVITAIDGNGAMSTITRTLVYDPRPPAMAVVDANPTSIKVTSSNGVVVARDKNGVIATPNGSNGSASLDLSGATYDQASLNISVLSPAGISSRNGDINGDGTVDIADALLAMRMSLGTAASPTFEQLLRGDVGPLVNHMPVPDGKIRLEDAILILKKAVGIDW